MKFPTVSLCLTLASLYITYVDYLIFIRLAEVAEVRSVLPLPSEFSCPSCISVTVVGRVQFFSESSHGVCSI